MINISNIEQGTPEWFDLRKLKLTGSNATPIGANGKGLETYCQEIVIDNIRITEAENYTNSDIERGNELEKIGRDIYEIETGLKITEVGFVENDKYKQVGVSPDGLIGEDGGIEIKARNDKKHFALIQGDTSDIPLNQIQMCLLITERKWWDFVSINVNFDKPIFIKRIYPDEKYFEKLKKGFERGIILIKEYTENYKNYKIDLRKC